MPVRNIRSLTISSLFVLLFLTTTQLSAQVNIERIRWHSETSESHALLETGASLKRGNTDISDFYINGLLGYREGNYIIFLLGDLDYGKRSDSKYLNRGVAHLRYNYLYTDKLAFEVFGQIEYDDFRLLKRRNIGGVGIRITLHHGNLEENSETGEIESFIVGLSYFYEMETYDLDWYYGDDSTLLNRLSTYLVANCRLPNQIRFNWTSYYQPAISDFNDYRFIAESNLTFQILEHLDFRVSCSYRYDNEPVVGVSKYDMSIRNTIVLML